MQIDFQVKQKNASIIEVKHTNANKVVVDSLLIVTPIVGFCNVLLYVSLCPF